MVRKFVFPLFIGFLGMLVCHIFILIAFGIGVRFPIYVIAYPIVYPTLALFLTIKKRELWLSNGLLVCILPLIYWYLLLWSDGKINFESFNILEDTGLLLIMPLITIFSFLISYLVSKKVHVISK